MSRSARLAIALLFVAWAVDFVDRLVVNFALTPIGDTFRLDHAERGLVVSVFFVAYAAMQIPGGLLADRFGAVRMCVIGMVAWSVCTGFTAAAWSFAALLVARGLFGATQGVFPAAAVKALAERVEPVWRNTANGWVNTASACGVTLAAGLAGLLLPVMGWRGMFVAISGMGVLAVLAWLRWLPRPLSGIASPVRRPAWRLLASPAIIGCAAISFGYGGLTWGLTTWAPTYLEERHGVAGGAAAALSTAPILAAAITTVVGGWLSDRLRGRPRLIVVPAMTVSGALVIALPYTDSVALFTVVLTALSGTAALSAMAALSVPLHALDAGELGAVAGLTMFGAQLAGIAFPLEFGIIVDDMSYTAAFASLALGPVVGIVAASLIPQTVETFRDAVKSRLDRSSAIATSSASL
ncbi:MFS transporter [Nocardia terpenica]|uniref:Major facilitator superfamily (MFS) profile domain-containing protein n=1 Tax=Nocardia terpenica TaxID=455432 RepID=A0A161XI91_9NOCA|nr:MFS transporter [Nocardia terpenica]KZM73368.1 hypothetical protein AWN90_32475 [Nocardia terpenica]NQE87472.1 MFS transporter [Nocardia terpenica]